MSPRDKDDTKKKILQSVRDILENGSEDLGINRIAELAGVDKVLIYRYFGGLPGLLSAFTKDGQVWPDFEEVMETAPYVAAMLPKEEIGARFVRGLIRELKDRPATLKILRQELVKDNILTRETAAVREQCLNELLECHSGDEEASALYGLVTAGLIHLMLMAKETEEFCGLPLRSAETWERIERAAVKIFEAK